MLRLNDFMVIFSGKRLPSVRFGNTARAERNQRRAQANSIARIASPAGITMNAGPGSKIMAIPMASTVPPTTKIITRLKCFIIARAVATLPAVVQR